MRKPSRDRWRPKTIFSGMGFCPVPTRVFRHRIVPGTLVVLLIAGCSGVSVDIDTHVADLSDDHVAVIASVQHVLYNNDPIGCSSSQVLSSKKYRIEYARDPGTKLRPLTIREVPEGDPRSVGKAPTAQEQLTSEQKIGPKDPAWQNAVSRALALVDSCGPPVHAIDQPCRTWITADHQWIVCAPMYTPDQTFALNGARYAARNDYVAFSRAAPLGRVITRPELGVPLDRLCNWAATLNNVASVQGELQLEFTVFSPPGSISLIVSPSSGRRHMMKVKQSLDEVFWNAQTECLIVHHYTFPTSQIRFTQWDYRANKTAQFQTDVARLFRWNGETLVPVRLAF